MLGCARANGLEEILKFDATSAHRLTVATPANRTSILIQLFAISNAQKLDLDIT